MSAARLGPWSRLIDNRLARFVAFAFVYWAGAELGHQLAFHGPYGAFATYWPPSGLYVAAMLAAGRLSDRLSLTLAALMANVASDVAMHGLPLPTSLGFWAANTIEAFAALAAIRRFGILRNERLCVRDAVGMALTAFACSGPLSALVGASALYLSFGGVWVDAFREWWISAAVSEIVFAPLVWTLLSFIRSASSIRWSRVPEGIVAVATLALVSVLIFHVGERPVAYMTVPCTLWLALRTGTAGTALGNVVLSVIAVWYTARGEGPLREIEPHHFRAFFIQTFNVTASLSGLILAAIVNERQQSLEQRIESDERFRDLFDNVSDLVAVTDVHGRILFANSAWSTIVGSTSGLNGHDLTAKLHPDSRDVFHHVLDCLPQAEVLTGIELRIVMQGGEALDVDGSFSCRSSTGATDRIRVILRDVTSRNVTARKLEQAHRQLENANQQLQLLAATDGLTTLTNRRAFYDRLAQECSAAGRHDRPVSLILIDVDHFKSYNDSFGHPAGDEALRAVGWLLKEGARDCDVVGRIGGEEFAVILPHTDENESLLVAERLRRMIGGHRWPLRRVTASLGVATFHGDEAEPDRLVEAADQALYQAKRAGRDQTVRAACRRLPSLAASG